MLIDDVILYGNDLKEQLIALGYDVFYSPTAVGITSFIQEFHPDLLFLDIELHENKDGIEVCKEVSVAYPSLPIIIISSHSDPAIKEQAVSSGALSYVEKPLTARLLAAYVERYITEVEELETLSEEINIDFRQQLIYFSDGSISTISPIQTLMLRILYDKKGEYVTLEELESAVWGDINRPDNSAAVIYNNISSIRRLFKPTQNTFLRSIRGVGYLLLVGEVRS